MGCVGCLPDVSEVNNMLNSISEKAKKLAIDNGENVFIYKEIDGSVSYMVESAARQEGIIPIRVVSFMS